MGNVLILAMLGAMAAPSTRPESTTRPTTRPATQPTWDWPLTASEQGQMMKDLGKATRLAKRGHEGNVERLRRDLNDAKNSGPKRETKSEKQASRDRREKLGDRLEAERNEEEYAVAAAMVQIYVRWGQLDRAAQVSKRMKDPTLYAGRIARSKDAWVLTDAAVNLMKQQDWEGARDRLSDARSQMTESNSRPRTTVNEAKAPDPILLKRIEGLDTEVRRKLSEKSLSRDRQ